MAYDQPEDGPTPEELRAFHRHPLTRRLNRELLAAFEADAKRLQQEVPKK